MMALDQATTLLLTQRLLGVGLLIQSVELFLGRRIYGSAGALAGRGKVAGLLAGRGVISVWLIVAPGGEGEAVTGAMLIMLLLSSAWLMLRSRGPVGGGSDSMFFQVQLGLSIAAFGFVNPLLTRLGLGWIAAQSVLSYFLAGFGKIQNAGWRDGTALRQLFASQGPYVLWSRVRGLAASQSICALLGWSVVLFELAFPALLLLPLEGKWVFVGLALGFHLINALVLGLNRFVWAWAATYPALLFFHPG